MTSGFGHHEEAGKTGDPGSPFPWCGGLAGVVVQLVVVLVVVVVVVLVS